MTVDVRYAYMLCNLQASSRHAIMLQSPFLVTLAQRAHQGQAWAQGAMTMILTTTEGVPAKMDASPSSARTRVLVGR